MVQWEKMREEWTMLSFLVVLGGFITAVMVLLTAEPKFAKRLTMIAGGLALAGGLFIYGYGYLSTADSPAEGLLHMVFAVCRMFIGEADFADLETVPLLQHWVCKLVCWFAHVLAVYATSSAAVSLIGANALKNLRVRLEKKKDLHIIYGVNEDSVEFGRALTEDLQALTVYVSEDAENPLSESIIESGGVLRADPKAVKGDAQFLKSLGVKQGRRQITLYALHRDYLKNIQYATALLEAFQQRGVESGRLSLVIHAREDEAAKKLQVGLERFGYGFVTVFQEPALAARLLTLRYPPCSSISFDAEGMAKENFETLVIGFGRLGQTVLRQLIMNGQFAGSTFRADVFAPDMEDQDGYFRNSFPEIEKHYQVHFHPYDGRSRQLYDHLKERLEHVKYITVCTGSETLNEEIGEDLRDFIFQHGRQIPVYLCSNRGIKVTDGKTGESEAYQIYHPDVLSTQKLDQMAMMVNCYYMGSYSKGALNDWLECDYFSRMSNRAFADFQAAVLKAAGKTEADALEGRWDFTPEQMENLGKMEHARWNAFHFCMGFSTMGEEEYAQRTAMYLREKEATGKGKTRIGKNLIGKTHACLISWDALDELSAKENAITGGSVDYKQMDRNNILILPELLKIRNAQK